MLSATGFVRVKSYVAGTLDLAMPLCEKYMEAMRSGLHEKAGELMKEIDAIFDNGMISLVSASPNTIMVGTLRGKDLLVQYLIAGTIYTGINYGGIGTGSTTPATTDTQLTTETARVTPSLLTDVSNNQAQIRFFFPDANLSNATYREFGTFMNASGTANSGKIFNHALFGTPYVKTTGVDTTVEVDISL